MVRMPPEYYSISGSALRFLSPYLNPLFNDSSLDGFLTELIDRYVGGMNGSMTSMNMPLVVVARFFPSSHALALGLGLGGRINLLISRLPVRLSPLVSFAPGAVLPAPVAEVRMPGSVSLLAVVETSRALGCQHHS